MITLEKYTVDNIKSLVKPLLIKHSSKEAILFGSYARGEATEESDIDIMVLVGKGFDPKDVFYIADELYDISGLRHRLVHDYDNTSWTIICDIVFSVIPEFKQQLEDIK